MDPATPDPALNGPVAQAGPKSRASPRSPGVADQGCGGRPTPFADVPGSPDHANPSDRCGCSSHLETAHSPSPPARSQPTGEWPRRHRPSSRTADIPAGPPHSFRLERAPCPSSDSRPPRRPSTRAIQQGRQLTQVHILALSLLGRQLELHHERAVLEAVDGFVADAPLAEREFHRALETVVTVPNRLLPRRRDAQDGAEFDDEALAVRPFANRRLAP